MKQKLFLLFSTIIVCIFLSEITLSLLIKKDLDNNLILNNLHLKPYRLPILETKVKLNNLLSSNDNNNITNVRLIPDPKLGWISNPFYQSNDSLYQYNNVGIRTDNIKKRLKTKTTIRIAIFGDSYSHGDEVKFDHTIGNYLEQLFYQNNYNVEVLNFAVSGYGIDQAYLRWQMVNNNFNPDIVILGVQFENVKRHINILRPFYSHITDIPYSKPRFIINDYKLKLLDNPITDITEIVDVIRNIDIWEFSKYEKFYNVENYESDIWDKVKTLSVVNSLVSRINSEFEYYNQESESYIITKELFNLFKYDVQKKEQIFIPVHLPTIDDFNFLYSTYLKQFHSMTFIYDEIFRDLKTETHFVETFDKLEKWSLGNNVEQLFMKRHYSSVANKIIAEQIYNFILEEHPQLFNN